MPSAGIHLPTDMLLARARRAGKFHPQAPLGRAFGASTEGENLKERAMIQAIPRKLMNRRAFLKASSTAAGAIAVNSQLSERTAGQAVDEATTSRAANP